MVERIKVGYECPEDIIGSFSPEEFIEIARRRIMESKSVPNFILGYAGLNRLKDSSKEDSF